MKYGLHGKFLTHEGKRDELVQVLLKAAAFMENIPSCDLYAVHISDDEPNAVWVTEIWKDAESHQASLQSQATKDLIQVGKPLIAGMEHVKLKTVGGKGVSESKKRPAAATKTDQMSTKLRDALRE